MVDLTDVWRPVPDFGFGTPQERDAKAQYTAKLVSDHARIKEAELEKARINATHLEGIQLMLADHNIIAHGEISAQRSGRYIATVSMDQTPNILKAVKATNAVVKPHRRKWNN